MECALKHIRDVNSALNIRAIVEALLATGQRPEWLCFTKEDLARRAARKAAGYYDIDDDDDDDDDMSAHMPADDRCISTLCPVMTFFEVQRTTARARSAKQTAVQVSA